MKTTFFVACLAGISLAIDFTHIDLAAMNDFTDFTLAQTASEVMEAERACEWVHNMAVKELPEFYELVHKSSQWKDPDFTTDNSSLYWADLG